MKSYLAECGYLGKPTMKRIIDASSEQEARKIAYALHADTGKGVSEIDIKPAEDSEECELIHVACNVLCRDSLEITEVTFGVWALKGPVTESASQDYLLRLTHSLSIWNYSLIEIVSCEFA